MLNGLGRAIIAGCLFSLLGMPTQALTIAPGDRVRVNFFLSGFKSPEPYQFVTYSLGFGNPHRPFHSQPNSVVWDDQDSIKIEWFDAQNTELSPARIDGPNLFGFRVPRWTASEIFALKDLNTNSFYARITGVTGSFDLTKPRAIVGRLTPGPGRYSDVLDGDVSSFVPVSAVPIPPAGFLLVGALGGLGLLKRRKKNRP